MADMISYTRAVLLAIAEFIGQPPMIYLFGCIVACFVIKAMKLLMSI